MFAHHVGHGLFQAVEGQFEHGEYLTDYASPAVAEQGRKLIETELAGMSDTPEKRKLAERLNRIRKSDERDLYV